MAGEIVAILLLVVGIVTALTLLDRDKPRVTVVLEVYEPPVGVDILNPTVADVEEALRRTDRGNTEALDWLLDQFNRAKEREAAS
jgi:hypothetical protein